MAKSKGNDASNQKFGPLPHHKASDAINKGLDRLKRGEAVTGQIQIKLDEIPSETIQPLFQKSTDRRRRNRRWQGFAQRAQIAVRSAASSFTAYLRTWIP